VIRVLNNIAPTITVGCNPNDLIVEDGGGLCNSRIRMRAEATDDCQNPLYYSYELDLNNNGTIDSVGNGRDLNHVVEPGMHRIIWTVRDECGNTTRCNRVYDVKDVKKPTPICYTQIVSVVMPSAGMITLWAKDFIKEATDNCTPANKIKFSFSELRKDSNRVFTCQDLVEYGTQGIPVKVYAFDTTGNFDFCEARLILQDNNNTCSGVTPTSRFSISGKVMDFDKKPMEGAEIKINADALGFPLTAQTSSTGNYEFKNLRKDLEYSWDAAMADDAIKGVNTLDIISIQRHILGLGKISDPMKMIAADVNFDQRITIGDLVALRQLILGIVDNFENGNVWKFITANDMPTIAELYPINEAYQIEKLASTLEKMDFMGIKMGDIDGSYANANLTGRSSKYITVKTNKTVDNLACSYELQTDGSFFINGLQMEFDIPVGTNIDNVTLNELNEKFDLDYFKNTNKGTLRIVITSRDGKPHYMNDQLISIDFSGSKPDQKLELNAGFLSQSYYVSNDIEEIYNLELRQAVDSDLGLKVHQNTPNPFTNETEVVFEIGKDEQVTIKVFNTEGKEVYSKSAIYPKGKNTVKISGQELDAEGILIYQILTKTHYLGRKMIKLK
jgi:hypothetical protein